MEPIDLNSPNIFEDTNGKHVIFLDIGRYAEMTEAQQAVYVLEFRGILEGVGIEYTDFTEDLSSFMEESAEGKGQHMKNFAGGRLFSFGEKNDEKLVVVDGRVSSLEQIANISLRNTMDAVLLPELKNSIQFDFASEDNQNYYDIFVRKHELAHALKGLEEAGADYMSVAETLKEYPESRATLQFVADMRLSQVLIPNANLADSSVAEKYGYESYMAIQSVLDMKPEELSKLSNQQLLDNAKWFDKLSEKNLEKQSNSDELKKIVPGLISRLPEERVFDSLRGGTAGNFDSQKLKIMSSGDYKAIHEHAASIQQENIVQKQEEKEMLEATYGEDVVLEASESDKILDKFVDAMERVSTTGYGQELKQATPQASPALDKNVAPALTH